MQTPTSPMIVLADDATLIDRFRAEALFLGFRCSLEPPALVVEAPNDSGDLAWAALGDGLTATEQESLVLVDETDCRAIGRSLRSIVEDSRTRTFSRLLTDGLFEAHLQPIVDVASGTVHGFEALLRLQRPDGHLIPPIEVFAEARRCGRLQHLEERALGSAFAAGQRLRPTESLFVNLDPSVPLRPAAVDDLIDGIRSVPGGARKVVIEVLENEGLDAPFTVELVHRLRSEGCKIALDDLGNGYSNFVALDRIRPDIVKVDRLLVHDAWRESYRRYLVEGLVDIAESLGVVVLAEGVETERDLAFVESLRIPLAQGFFFAPAARHPLRDLSPIARPVAA